MGTLPKLLCAITLLSMSGLVWASCPEGYRENDRSGECTKIRSWVGETKPSSESNLSSSPHPIKELGTKEAIEYYLKGRYLEPIEGAWIWPDSAYDAIIVKNDFGIHTDYEYLAIVTRSDRKGWRQSDLTPELRLKIFLRATSDKRIFMAKYVCGNRRHKFDTKLTLADQHRVDIDGGLCGFDWWTGNPMLIPPFSLYRTYPKDEGSVNVSSRGTGFFVSSNGYIVTNHHVIQGANKITVTTQSGESFQAKVVSKSTATDLALLRIPYQTKNYLTFANPGSTDTGQQVFTLGYPVSDILGKEVKYTDGSISSLSGLQGDATFFQISVPIQPGNSGGPLVNLDGDVVGVVTATAAVKAFYKSVGTMPQNINWAVKGTYASLLLPPTMEMNERPKSNPVANAKWSVVFIETE